MKKSKTKRAKDKTSRPTVVDSLLASLPVLTPGRRAAFRSLFTDAQCDAWGAQTKGEGVRREAEAWAPAMQAALERFPDLFDAYGPARLAWLLACARDLEDALAAQEGEQGVAHVAKRGVEQAETAARAVRGALVRKLGALAGGIESEKEALSTALGTTDSARDLAASLRSLAQHARGWMARGDAVARELVADARLDAAFVARADDAAGVLEAAIDGKTLEGAANVRDTPDVNRAEGRLLREMKVAMEAFDDAHEADRRVPRLIPGAATRRVLAPKRPKPAPKAPDPAPPEPTETPA